MQLYLLVICSLFTCVYGVSCVCDDGVVRVGVVDDVNGVVIGVNWRLLVMFCRCCPFVRNCCCACFHNRHICSLMTCFYVILMCM